MSDDLRSAIEDLGRSMVRLETKLENVAEKVAALDSFARRVGQLDSLIQVQATQIHSIQEEVREIQDGTRWARRLAATQLVALVGGTILLLARMA